MSDEDGPIWNGLIASVYEAAAGADSWESVFRSLLDALEGSSALLMVLDAEGRSDLLALSGASSTALRLYADYYHRLDPWATLGTTRVSMRAALGSDFVPDEVFARSEFWNDYARLHVGAFHMVGAAIPLDEGRVGILGVHRPRDARAFDAESRVKVERLLPHIRSGLRLRKRLAGATAAARAAEDALALLEFGVVITASDGTCLYANPEAERIAAARDTFVLRTRGNPVDAARPDDARSLRRLIADAGRGGAGGALTLSRPGQAAVVVLVVPLPNSFARSLGAEATHPVMIALRDEGDAAPMASRVLRAVYGLTEAEARLAMALCRGRSLAEVSDELKVAMSTLRFHLSALLAKTDTRRQSELVRRFGRLPQIRSQFPPK